MRNLCLVFLFLLFSFGINAQSVGKIVEIKGDALKFIPQDSRKSLIERLNLYIESLNKKDLKSLYSLISVRVRKGLNEKEFLETSKIESEDKYLYFSIREVKKADEDDYVDEPKPKIGEGNKWFVTGCMKYKDAKGKVKFYERGYDVWLTNTQWYISRNGFRLIEGGYKSCSLIK